MRTNGEIGNDELSLEAVPEPSSDIGALFDFALTYNGYREAGSDEACARIANERRHDTLDDLRTCLFFEQRRYRHFGTDPEKEDLEYIRDIVRRIRGELAERDHQRAGKRVAPARRWSGIRSGEVAVNIESRDHWFKVIEMLQQNWALVDARPGRPAVAFFVDDDSGVFDRMEFESRRLAEEELRHNGFRRLATDRTARGFLVPPKGPYFESVHPNGRIYSSGRFWSRPASTATRSGSSGASTKASIVELANSGALRVATDPGRLPAPPHRSVAWERVEGMLLGLAIGDSLGNTSESKLPSERRSRHGEIRSYLPNRHAGGRAIGLPSDDTQLAFWTLEELLEHGRVEPDALAAAFATRRIYGIGSTVRAFLGARRPGANWLEAAQESAGNGALMRIAPVLLPYLERPTEDLWRDAVVAGPSPTTTLRPTQPVGPSLRCYSRHWRRRGPRQQGSGSTGFRGWPAPWKEPSLATSHGLPASRAEW